MQDMQVVVILLSVIVAILSVMVIVLLGLVIALLVKFRQIASWVDVATTNIAKATEWLSPARVFSEIGRLFSKNK